MSEEPDRSGRAEQAHRSLPAHFREKSPLTDTAGVPWAGRDYTVSPFPDDDGSAPPELARALRDHRMGADPHRQALVTALAANRVLVPIMAVATDTGTTAHGLTGDNGADMAMVSITASDGSMVLPIFSSVAQLAAWRTDARPVPVVAAQAAQAAVQEGCTALLVDAASGRHAAGRDTAGQRHEGQGAAGEGRDDVAGESGPILLPRSVLWALAQGREWIPPHLDPDLAAALDRLAEATDHVFELTARAGERSEVDLHLRLRPGLTKDQVRAVVDEVSTRLGADALVAERISSLRLVLGT
ncbi:hypothetical protein BH708_07170 [Brachybacterium sp. P6-10-X1]|uniref:SseB family protein n=1 Tax=Brachybacterium sp. P6-10-X1 TaxID=1903186 RepID=UPI0009717840|nr:SseB family protein [Brachybacterium sp. P6-10-X1]APX32540.1 hypothetical protein BH708_07170 [Brachybacterium sp. P6-10-X1]